MEITLLVSLVAIVYLIVLNGYMNGRVKLHIDALLSILWLSFLAIAFLGFGWRSGAVAIAISLMGAVFLRPLARRTAAFLYAHPPHR